MKNMVNNKIVLMNPCYESLPPFLKSSIHHGQRIWDLMFPATLDANKIQSCLLESQMHVRKLFCGVGSVVVQMTPAGEN